MACFIMTLPSEILSLIFGSLEDLDDAQSLSQTCQTLRELRVTHQKRIDRAIVVRLCTMFPVNDLLLILHRLLLRSTNMISVSLACSS